MRTVLITSSHQRHRWVAAALLQAGLAGVVIEEKPSIGLSREGTVDPRVSTYLAERAGREAQWFARAPKTYAELGVPLCQVAWGGSNSDDVFRFVAGLSPDRVALFGSSIIRDPLLSRFAGSIINMHLGLSPYYRGSATNFWPLVHGLPECVGVTLHHATLRVDGGHVLGQRRPPVVADDGSHDLGCKAIIEGAVLMADLLSRDRLSEGRPQVGAGVLCRRSDFTPESIDDLHMRLRSGMLTRYIEDKRRRDERYPIVDNL